MKRYFLIMFVSFALILFFAKAISMFDKNLTIVPNPVQAMTKLDLLEQPIDDKKIQTINNKKFIPVLMYHLIEKLPSENKNSNYLYVTPENFEQQVKFLAENGYTFLLPEQIPQAESYVKPVIITFDDGYSNNFFNAYPILKKYNAKATIFVIVNKIGENTYCTADQLKEMSDSGVIRIGSHTYSHTDLSKLSVDKVRWEFITSRDIIYNITKYPVTTISYPYGYYTDETLREASKIFNLGFGVHSSKNQTSINIGRLTVTNDKTSNAFKCLLGE